MKNIFRVLVAAILATNLGMACTSVELPAKVLKKGSDVVFRGKITEYIDSGTNPENPKVPIFIVVYQVSRVWKGRVGGVMKLTTFPGYSEAPCWFGSTRLAPVGADVVVFAEKVKGQKLLGGYWTGTRDVEYYNDGLTELGPGRPPNSE